MDNVTDIPRKQRWDSLVIILPLAAVIFRPSVRMVSVCGGAVNGLALTLLHYLQNINCSQMMRKRKKWLKIAKLTYLLKCWIIFSVLCKKILLNSIIHCLIFFFKKYTWILALPFFRYSAPTLVQTEIVLCTSVVIVWVLLKDES